MEKISIIIPCFNEEESIPLFYDEITKKVKAMKVKFEYIFINDGSNDDTLNILRKLAKKDKSVRYISFTKNFGKEAGMLAGLEAAKGDYVAIMDVDLQDPPELIADMYNTLKTTDYDCVASRRVSRVGEPKLISFFARMYYRIINKISNTEIVNGARDFRLMSRSMVNSVLKLREYNRFSKGLFSFVGYKTKWLEYENKQRVAGTTKWNFWKLFLYAIESIVSFSTFPLMIALLFGMLLLMTAFVMLIIIIVGAFTGTVFNLVIPFLIVSIGGIQLICMGFLGLYLSKTYTEVKHRPIYLVKETENGEN